MVSSICMETNIVTKKSSSKSIRVSTRHLQREVALLRSAVMGLVGQDSEGTYRPELVREVFASLEQKPSYEISSSEAFLKRLEKYVPAARG